MEIKFDLATNIGLDNFTKESTDFIKKYLKH